MPHTMSVYYYWNIARYVIFGDCGSIIVDFVILFICSLDLRRQRSGITTDGDSYNVCRLKILGYSFSICGRMDWLPKPYFGYQLDFCWAKGKQSLGPIQIYSKYTVLTRGCKIKLGSIQEFLFYFMFEKNILW